MIKIVANARTYVRAHKIISSVFVLLLLIGGYYSYIGTNTAAAVTKYVVENAVTGSVISDVSGVGQVQAGTTISVTPKVSEEVTSIPVKIGQHVSVGQLLVQLDPTNEQRSLQQAQLSFQQAQLSAEQTNEVATTTLLQQQNAVTTDEQDLVNASTSLVTDYQTDFNDLGPAFVNLQTVMSGLKSFVTGYDISKSQQDPDAYISLLPTEYQGNVLPYRNTLLTDYNDAEALYTKNLSDYEAVNTNASSSAMDALFVETGNTAKSVNDAVKAAKDFLDYVTNTYDALDSMKPLPTVTTTFEANFSSYGSTMNSTVSGLDSTITGLANDRTSIVTAQNSLQEASETLSETLAGPTQTTLLSQQISLESAQNALQTAQENLAYTSVRAPIAGTISAISAVVGQTAGSSAVTIVSDGEVAQITLNEIDAAKVQTGDQATLTFDAISGLSLAGQVVEIDPVGTVSQGVVSYNVQVSFSQSANVSSSQLVKPGMSVSVDIITQAHQNVIAVPNAAVVTVGGSSYVLEPATPLSDTDLAASANGGIVLAATPTRVPVTIGLTSATMTEVTSGIKVGDQIVVQTVKSTATTKSAAPTGGSAFQLLGGSGGGAVRAGGFTGGKGGFGG